MGVLAGDLLDTDHGFVAGLVRQPRCAGDVADGVDARFCGGAIRIGDDMAALDLDRRTFQAELFHIADDAGGGQDHVSGQTILVLAIELQRPLLGLTNPALAAGKDARAGVQVHALLAQRIADILRYFLVFHRQYAVGHFDHADLGAQRMIKTGELDADGAGPERYRCPYRDFPSYHCKYLQSLCSSSVLFEDDAKRLVGFLKLHFQVRLVLCRDALTYDEHPIRYAFTPFAVLLAHL